MPQQRLRPVEETNGPEGDDTLLPTQFWIELADPRTEPTKRLMVAVLEEAIALVVNGTDRSGDQHAGVVREAERWFASEDRGAPFAFGTICDVLGLDIGRVRQTIAGWRRREQVFRRPRLQAGRGRHLVRAGERGRCRAA